MLELLKIIWDNKLVTLFWIILLLVMIWANSQPGSTNYDPDDDYHATYGD